MALKHTSTVAIATTGTDCILLTGTVSVSGTLEPTYLLHFAVNPTGKPHAGGVARQQINLVRSYLHKRERVVVTQNIKVLAGWQSRTDHDRVRPGNLLQVRQHRALQIEKVDQAQNHCVGAANGSENRFESLGSQQLVLRPARPKRFFHLGKQQKRVPRLTVFIAALERMER